ncbi:hypothetical protein EJ04DRAFT_488329 [Polyplosphaeria fusca]|uniref:SPX domain-containing protein n=1 Tax=Polyplosphaeria fusca TaxID=682080 RepID=A0A9P4R184_9PLEO|nr:hypothetical protein EJ04DRAFT_488329 [Polyplosphaeria fusca]
MKYGDTLRQRSIPEWGHYNIDYDYLKDLIKYQTTSREGKAVSIPGQGDTQEKAFGDTFLKVLKAQHDRVNLFVKSKSGEIERRLEYIRKSLAQLQSQRHDAVLPLPARTVEKYAKIDADVIKAGEEIRSLSRFRVVQRTGFVKILKKYKRWTRDRELEHQFKTQVLNSPDSFFQMDLGVLLDQYIEVLAAVRAPLNEHSPTGANARNTPSRIGKALEEGTDVDYDIALSTIPLGSQGCRAVYWIHPDHVVEIQVLILQHMRLYTGGNNQNSVTPDDSASTTSNRRKSCATLDKYLGSEEDTGFIILDNAESFGIKQNASTVGASEDATGAIRAKAAGHALWTATGEAAVVVGLQSMNVKAAKLKRKHLGLFVKGASLHEQEEHDASRGKSADVRQWLAEHPDVKAVAGFCAKRTRFVGLQNTIAGGLWATIDRDIFMKEHLLENLGSNEWLSGARNGSREFPHAVLEIRREGNYSTSLIHSLDHSHLVERVRGFSLEAHSVWACCKPSTMTAPIWMTVLDIDIRKLPEPVKRRRRKGSSTTETTSRSPPSVATSTSTPPMTDGQSSSPQASRGEDTSATSAPEFIEPPPLRAFRKKRKLYAKYPPLIEDEPPQRYWNEYDNPSEDEEYYIYVDPTATLKYPGQDLFEAFARKTRVLLGMHSREDEEDALLSGAEDATTDDDDTADETPVTTPKTYGTMERERNFGNMPRFLGDSVHNADRSNMLRRSSGRGGQTLFTEIERRQHAREMTKLRLYSICLASAVVIDIILSALSATSRKKERGVVDVIVLFGAICSLILLIIAVSSMLSRRERLGWLHQGFVCLVTIGVVVADVLLLRWVINL